MYRMSIAPGYTDEEIRSIVFEYERLRYGTKGVGVPRIVRDAFRKAGF